MSGDQPADKVASDVQSKMQDKQHGGADQAYQTMLKEATDATKNMSQTDQQAFYKQLNSDLQQKGLLGIMTLEYANDPNNFGLISERNGMGSTVVDQTAAQRDMGEANLYGGNNPVAAFHAAMDGNLVNAFQQAAQGKDTFLGDTAKWGDGLTSDQIKSQLGDSTKSYTELQGKIDSRGQYSDLLSSDGGKPSTLFTVLDTAKDGGNGDGKISQDDLNAYLDHASQLLKDTGHDPKDFSALPKNYDPKDPGSIYNQEYVKEVQAMQKNFDQLSTHHNALAFWESNYITKDSLSQSFGYDKTGGMWEGKQSSPTDNGNGGSNSNPPQPGKLTEDTAKKGVEDYLSLPQSAADTLFPPDSTDPNNVSKRIMTPDTLNATLKAGGLTPNQEAYLNDLKNNWPADNNAPVSLGDIVQKAGYSLDDNASNSLLKHEQDETKAAQGFLDNVTQNINLKQDFNNQPITQDSITAAMSKIADGNKGSPDRLDQNPDYQALSNMKQHFNDLTTNGQTISEQDLQTYASAYDAKFNGFKPDVSNPSNGNGNGGDGGTGKPGNGNGDQADKPQAVVTVGENDTLWGYSQKYKGVTPQTIYEYNKQLWMDRFGPNNKNDNPNFILNGWQIKIPPAGWQPGDNNQPKKSTNSGDPNVFEV